MRSENRYDVVIIGAGAAGLAAAGVLGRCKRRVAVVGGPERANTNAERVHNLPYAEGVAPEALYSTMEQQLVRFGVALVRETVESVSISDDTERLDSQTRSGRITAGRLLLATGLEYDVPGWVPSEAWGKAVFTCPFCHAYEHDGEPFVVVGKGGVAVDMALLCAVHANPLTVLVTDTEATTGTAADMVRGLGGAVVTDAVKSAACNATGGLDLITTAGAQYRAGAVLLVGIMKLRTELASQLGIRTNELGIPENDKDGRTSHPRIWVAGTAAQPHYMLAESVGSGIRAGISIHKDLCQAGQLLST